MLGSQNQIGLTNLVVGVITAIAAVGFSVVAAGPALAAAPTWTVEQSPPLPAQFSAGELTAVSCAASTCLAVGDGQDPYEEPYYLSDQWNGVSWTSEQTPGTNGNGFYMTGVACPTATTCWATGTASYPNGPSPLLWSLGQGGWNNGNLAGNINTGDLNGISCTSTQFCMAVGDVGSKALAERWDGKRWHFMALQKTATSGFTGPSFSNVGCGGPDSCMAVGLAKASGALGAVEHWNGKDWKEQPTPTMRGAKGGNLGDVSCPTATECIAVGTYKRGSVRLALSEMWNGRHWKLLSTPNQPLSPKNSALWSISCGAANACAAVGTPGPYPLLEWWDGTSWTLQPMPANVPGGAGLIAVSCSSVGGCTAVGHNGSKNFAMATTTSATT